MFFSRLGCSLGVLFLLVACGQTSVPSDASVQILRELPVVPTQAALATVPVVTPTKLSTTVVPSVVAPTAVMTSLPETAVSPTPPIPTQSPTPSPYTIIGTSAANHPLVSYQFGHGEVPLIFVGGIHGGYEWNTILLAYEMIDYFTKHRELIPENITLYIIPSANPDGQFLVTGRNGRFDPTDIPSDTEEILGRFNANGVDLNRNWDCEWQSTALWRDQPISGGASPFSEPETSALRDYFIIIQPAIVLFWHSAANGVYAAGCPETHAHSYALATIYGEAADYPVFSRFDAYPVTGDASDWLTIQNIPSITIELANHQELDWEQNLAGVSAILNYFGSLGSHVGDYP